MITAKRVRWEGHVAGMGVRRGAYRILLGKPGGKRAFAKPKRRWKDNILTDVQGVVWRAWTDIICLNTDN